LDIVKAFKIRKGLWFKRAPQKEPVKKYPIRRIESESEE
jgi:hypothetical protein